MNEKVAEISEKVIPKMVDDESIKQSTSSKVRDTEVIKNVKVVHKKEEDGGVTTFYKCDQCTQEYPKRWQAAKHQKRCGRKSGKQVRFHDASIKSCLVCKVIVQNIEELKQHLFDFHNDASIFGKYCTSFDKLIGVK